MVCPKHVTIHFQRAWLTVNMAIYLNKQMLAVVSLTPEQKIALHSKADEKDK